MGGGGQTQTTTIPPKTENELELERLNLETARRQAQLMVREQALASPALSLETLRTPAVPKPNPLFAQQQASLAAYNQAYPPTGLEPGTWAQHPDGTWYQVQAAPGAPPVTAPEFLTDVDSPLRAMDTPVFRQQLQDVLDQQARDRALLTGPAGPGAPGTPTGTSGLALSQAAQDLIAQQFAAARTTGEQDIRRFAEQLGGQRGLRLTDTPIGAEALRQQERLATELRGGEAGTTLEFQEGLRRFQQGLIQQAAQNRMALAGLQPPGIGLGLNFGFQERAAQSTVNTSIRQPFAQTFGQIAGGVGGLALGVGLGFGGLGLGPSIGGFSGLGGFAQSMRHSDKRLKRDIRVITDALTKLSQLTGVSFRWLDHDSTTHMGVLAQEVETVLPELVTTDTGGRKLVDYSGLIGVLVQAVNELRERIVAQEPLHG